MKITWAKADYLCKGKEVTVYAKHYEEPICHKTYREEHKPYNRTTRQNIESENDDPQVVIEITEKYYRKKRGKRRYILSNK